MAELMDDAEFWLPAKFLTDDDGVMKKVNLKNENATKNETVFPYEFDSFDSVVESTETESSDEDEFLAGFTRRLAYSASQKLTVPTLSLDKNEKNGALASSPRSTLSGLGCWSSSSNNSPNGPSQVPSPPTTPFSAQNDTWDLISAAAGQVARLKMSHERALPKPQNQALPFNLFNGRQAQVQQQHIQGRTMSNLVGGRPLGLSQSCWPPLQVQSKQKQPQTHPGSAMRAVFLGGSGGVKRECAGTGVFIPRRYDTSSTSPEPRKKAGCSTVLLPAKVVQALNLNFDGTNNSHVQPQFNPGFASNYEALVARRNASLTQARRNHRQEGSLNLPQEWTY
ncbi:hypothetical protein like AT2G39870 [Hibiscus trionum]|uniref:Uncharacterized protein n=1 Tax=Hibiscus trionum TaxID=183268 RepID=A0A9W7HZ45_HIBTR|nr:hypothetical protein like AT2G39870 [Hibiscus trionum]